MFVDLGVMEVLVLGRVGACWSGVRGGHARGGCGGNRPPRIFAGGADETRQTSSQWPTGAGPDSSPGLGVGGRGGWRWKGCQDTRSDCWPDRTNRDSGCRFKSCVKRWANPRGREAASHDDYTCCFCLPTITPVEPTLPRAVLVPVEVDCRDSNHDATACKHDMLATRPQRHEFGWPTGWMWTPGKDICHISHYQ
ncbi:unnamed protein product [Protopolystoma xenopodis]|uniref:Uncharacterized protein n=1 Tax=Protopolystoma xenopodis TaxID=117903 RepID=A0A3S5AXD2_9PLAT|nr:unnamed protein product [Protopolystoma xenopodis]